MITGTVLEMCKDSKLRLTERQKIVAPTSQSPSDEACCHGDGIL